MFVETHKVYIVKVFFASFFFKKKKQENLLEKTFIA